MKEDFLHFLWKTQRFDPMGLKTVDGENIEILHFGNHNSHAGPDFLDGQIRINGILWSGNIEMHINASEWYRHSHQDDPAYENVILHVVLNADREVFRSDGSRIPTIDLKKRVPSGLIRTYNRLMHNEHWIPCQNQIPKIADIIKTSWSERLMVERLERKTTAFHKDLEKKNWDWEAAFFQALAKNFGLKVNAIPFVMLAESIPLVTLLRHRDRLIDVEALLYGQAGMLDMDFEDEYPQLLKRNYLAFKNKYKLLSIPIASWKYLRLRPANFPSIRIAQLARLIHQSNHLFSKVLAVQSIKDLETMFELKISNYWKDHYQFDKLSIVREKKLGTSTIQLFAINTILPFLFLYGKRRGLPKFQELAIRLYQELPAEKNSIIEGWNKLGWKAESAYDSQSLIELKNEYCKKKRCLSCSIGAKILKSGENMKSITMKE